MFFHMFSSVIKNAKNANSYDIIVNDLKNRILIECNDPFNGHQYKIEILVVKKNS